MLMMATIMNGDFDEGGGGDDDDYDDDGPADDDYDDAMLGCTPTVVTCGIRKS